MKDSMMKKVSGKKDEKQSSSLIELEKKRAQLTLEIALGKSQDTAELAAIRKAIARRLTTMHTAYL